MSLFRHVLNLDAPVSNDLPVHPDAPLPPMPVGETASVRRIAQKLSMLEPSRARFVAAFAYLLSRAAHADLAVSDDEVREMQRLVQEVAGLDEETAHLIVALADAQEGEFGATEDYLVTREFKAIASMEERERLLRCCLLVMAIDDNIDATESWLANRMAEELDIERQDLNHIRAEFLDKISGVKEARKLAQN